ncbi:N-acetyl-D-Glu racemase DgcA [Segnochrobactraceae bacterium EtOH-i3]
MRIERFAIEGGFTIARGSKREAVVIVVEVRCGAAVGRGECVPYGRYGETIESVLAEITALVPALESGLERPALQMLIGPGAARNAIDCALWDLEAKRTGIPVRDRLGLAAPRPLTTAFTLSLAEPDAMEAAARRNAHRPLLKIKLGGPGDLDRLAAVRRGAPAARLVVDANEGWTDAFLAEGLAACAAAGVVMVEQPLPAGADGLLARIPRPVPVCADESHHVAADVAGLTDRYDAVNLKLDKAGGLTEALKVVMAVGAANLQLMVGCMVSSSLAMAPALLVADSAEVVDLDGPLLLSQDRQPGLVYAGSVVQPAERALWG